jgi:hypothetical protein
MSKYRPYVDYRKIYVEHHGPIPIDDDGRSFDVHHLDGDPTNNDPANLIALSVNDHYELHLSQQDWHACLLIASRLHMSPEEKSNLSKQAAQKRVDNGVHHFLDPKWQKAATQKAIASGRHNFIGGEVQRKRIARNDHPFVGDNNISKRRIDDGTHHFLGGKIQSTINSQRVANGTHNLLGGDVSRLAVRSQLESGRHSSQKQYTCPHCQRIGFGSGMKSKHFDNCKKSPTYVRKQHAIRICPNCGKIGRGSNMTRYHFDKCKMKQ